MLLSTVVLSTDPHANRNEGRYSNLRNLDVDAIKQHVEGLFSKAIDPQISRQQFMKHLANIHWWMANAMLDHRGSATKTELCVRALAQARGIDLPPMQHGVLADLEAITTRRKDFIKNYQQLLEH